MLPVGKIGGLVVYEKMTLKGVTDGETSVLRLDDGEVSLTFIPYGAFAVGKPGQFDELPYAKVIAAYFFIKHDIALCLCLRLCLHEVGEIAIAYKFSEHVFCVSACLDALVDISQKRCSVEALRGFCVRCSIYSASHAKSRGTSILRSVVSSILRLNSCSILQS